MKYRIRVRQELEYLVEAGDEDEAWAAVESEGFGDPVAAVRAETPDILWLRPER